MPGGIFREHLNSAGENRIKIDTESYVLLGCMDVCQSLCTRITGLRRRSAPRWLDAIMNMPEHRNTDSGPDGEPHEPERLAGCRGPLAQCLSKGRKHWRSPVFRNIALTVLLVIIAATITQFVPLTSISILRSHTPASTKNNVVAESVDVLAEFTQQLLGNGNLPPAAQAALVKNLRAVHADILYTESEIKKNPNDANLRALLVNLYQQQADLMNEAQQAQVQTLPGAGT
jgi:hypothetical protein